METITKQLADIAIQDGQNLRPFADFLSVLYDEIKGREFSFDETIFTDRIEFYEHIKGVCEYLIESGNEWKFDQPEEYTKAN